MQNSLIPLFEEHKDKLPAVRPGEIELYQKYFAFLCEYNEKVNLVSRASLDRAFAIHFCDSLFTVALCSEYPLKQTFDVGTGGGFPGVSFAIHYPDKEITLCEKLQKKRLFLSELVTTLGLTNVKILPELDRKDKKYALYFARAVFPGIKYFKYFLDVARPGSVLVRNIGGSTVDDFDYPSGVLLKETKEYELPGAEGKRKLQFFDVVSRGTKIG